MLQVAAILGFVIISTSPLGEVGKIAVLAAFAASTVLVLWREVQHSTWRRMVVITLSLAAMLVVVHQILGFTVFPGLLKDVEPMTTEQLRIAVLVFALAFIGYAAGAFLATLLVGLLRRVK
jgi:hypothetical protein